MGPHASFSRQAHFGAHPWGACVPVAEAVGDRRARDSRGDRCR